jgi:predicted dinucleotide-binding enzyme
MVGQALASKLVSLGHSVTMGSRDANNEKGTAWAQQAGELAKHGTFAEAARFGEAVVNAVNGAVALDVLHSIGADALNGKTLIDMTNGLDFTHGMPPTLTVANTDSIGEQIQRAFPDVSVVKTLNTMNAAVMVNPGLLPGTHHVFVCGNDDQAKASVAELLTSFGWPTTSILDLGDISNARGTEMYLPLWLRLWGKVGSGHFNIRVVTP